MKDKKIKLDYEKLCAVLCERGITKAEFSRKIGRNSNFVNCLKQYKEVHASTEALICNMLEVPVGYFVKEVKPEEPELKQNADAGAKAIENIYKLLNQVKDDIESLKIQNEKIFSKANANTVQLEKIKERLHEAMKTDFDRAYEFLEEQLSIGKVDGVELLQKCEAAGLKRSEVMKAKKELDVHISTTGYGKNQKSFWYIPR